MKAHLLVSLPFVLTGSDHFLIYYLHNVYGSIIDLLDVRVLSLRPTCPPGIQEVIAQSCSGNSADAWVLPETVSAELQTE